MSADLTKLLKIPKDEQMSRPQVNAIILDVFYFQNLYFVFFKIVKYLWAYLKEHNLQVSENKQRFTPDKAMESIFGKEKIKAFGMTKYLKGRMEWFEMMTPVVWLYLIRYMICITKL